MGLGRRLLSLGRGAFWPVRGGGLPGGPGAAEGLRPGRHRLDRRERLLRARGPGRALPLLPAHPRPLPRRPPARRGPVGVRL